MAQKSSVNKKNIKKEINGENNIKIIITALVLAVTIGIVVYFCLGKNNDKELSDVKNNDSNSEEKFEFDLEDEEKSEETKEEQKNNNIVVVETTKDENDENKVTVEQAVNNNEEENENNDVVKTYYAITFNTNGGNSVDKQIFKDDEVTESVIPTKEGWSFAGWFTDENLTEEFIFGDVISKDITLHAKWVKMIQFVSGNEIIKMIPVAENEEIILPTNEELTNYIDTENEEATWIFTGNDEYDEEYSVEVTKGTKFDSNSLRNDSAIIKLEMNKLAKFDVEFYLTEQDEEPVYTLKVVETKTIDFDAVDEQLSDIENLPETYGWYFRNILGLKINYSRDRKANSNITKLYLDGTYKVTYKEQQEIENEIQEVIVKEENVVVDSRLDEENILVPEEKEGFNFEGWLLVDDNNDEKTYLDEELVIDSDKTFVAEYVECAEEKNPDEEIIPLSETEEEVIEEPIDEEITNEINN